YLSASESDYKAPPVLSPGMEADATGVGANIAAMKARGTAKIQLPKASTPIVREVHLCKGNRLEQRISSGTGPRGVVSGDGSVMELVAMFDLTPPNITPPSRSERPTCIDVLWKISPGPGIRKALLVDEMYLVLLQGEVKLTIQGGEACRVSAGSSNIGMIWVSGDPRGLAGRPGIPPLTINVVGRKPVIVLAQFYAWSGVSCSQPDPLGFIELHEGPIWTREEVETYWQVIDTHVHQMRRRTPFVATLSKGPEQLASLMNKERRSAREDVHNRA